MKYKPSAWAQNELNAIKKDDTKLRSLIFVLVALAFYLVLYQFKIVQDQQSLIIAYEEYERANTETMYCVFNTPTLTVK